MEGESFGKKDALLTVKQAASILTLSVPTIKNYIYTGKLKSVKTPGGHHRVRLSDLSNSMGVNFQEFTIDKPFLDRITRLIKVIEKRELLNQNHAESVARFSQEIAAELQFSESRKNDLQLAALLHDIGKINIAENILNKPGLLTEVELSNIKKHPEIGGEITRFLMPNKRLSLIVRQHHERFDGRGYPDGLSGREIQLEARIIAIAEAFAFMIQDKPYRKAISLKKAFEELEKGTDAQFDQELVELFLKRQKEK